MSSVRCVPALPCSYHLPAFGFGTYELQREVCCALVAAALQGGYRLIDTAAVYRNEAEVGEGIVASGVPRAELFVVVKIAMKAMHDTAKVREGVLESIRKLRIGYADAVLLHWPACSKAQPQEGEKHAAARRRTWEALMELQAQHHVRHVGVSNFLPRHFKEIDEVTAAQPQDAADPAAHEPILNQIELHPLCVQEEVVQYCRSRGMVLQQYSPLGNGDTRLTQHAGLAALVARYFAPQHYTVYDVLLWWGLAQGFCTLVRSSKAAHVKHNLSMALLYFDSVAHHERTAGADMKRSRQALEEDTLEKKAEVPSDDTPPLLSKEQLDVVKNLRALMGVEEDVHLCWYSDKVL